MSKKSWPKHKSYSGKVTVDNNVFKDVKDEMFEEDNKGQKIVQGVDGP